MLGTSQKPNADSHPLPQPEPRELHFPAPHEPEPKGPVQPAKLIAVLIVLAAPGLKAAIAAKTEKPATVNARKLARREGLASNAASARRRLKKSVIIWVRSLEALPRVAE